MVCEFYYPILQVMNWGFCQGTQLVMPEAGFKPRAVWPRSPLILAVLPSASEVDGFFLNGFSKNVNYLGNGGC